MYEHMWLIFVVPTCNYLSFITRNRVFDFKIMQYFMKKKQCMSICGLFLWYPHEITFLLLLETEFLTSKSCNTLWKNQCMSICDLFLWYPHVITFLLLLETEFLSFELTVNKEVLKVVACSFPLMLALN